MHISLVLPSSLSFSLGLLHQHRIVLHEFGGDFHSLAA